VTSDAFMNFTLLEEELQPSPLKGRTVRVTDKTAVKVSACSGSALRLHSCRCGVHYYCC
jgi:hypothetical protein